MKHLSNALLSGILWCPVVTMPAQEPAGQPAAPATSERLEQLVAPIALYPDALLAQVLMASTYPLEVVQAARWQQENELSGDALEQALQEQGWDPSVKSLCGLPSVLGRLNDNLEWTSDLGDAFLADQAAVMDAVQNMRRKALEAGTLKTTDEQTVTEREDKIIVVEATQTEVVYVPTYYPTAVYGGWYYPNWYYPTLYAPPPPGYPAFSFKVGVAWGAAIWGGCRWGWGHTEIDIDIDRQNNFIDRTEVSQRASELKQRTGSASGRWQHDAQHRKGVQYRDTTARQRYASGPSNRLTRDQARGYAPGNRQPTTRQQPTPRQRPASPSAAYRTTGTRSGSFTGARSPGLDRAASQRGRASLSRSSLPRGGGRVRRR